MLAKKLQQAVAGAGGEALYVENVFSTYLYTGNGSTQTITNNIDLSGEGGFVWIKRRSTPTTNHTLYDTARGATKRVYSNLTNAEDTDISSLTSFNSDGFSLDSDSGSNLNAATYASWTFRKAPKFFDVVTYTGNGVAGRRIDHNLGSVPGCIIIKRTNTTESWVIYHRAIDATSPEDYYLRFDTSARIGPTSVWNYETHTDTNFVLDADSMVNGSGSTYVAYLFAHDAGGFGDAGDENVISCGSFNSGESNQATITLGWEPQWVLIKDASASSDWWIVDNMRGMSVGSNQAFLRPNTNGAETSTTYLIRPTATGFTLSASPVYNNNETYIYIAIRRGPMKTPESGTDVYAASIVAGDSAAKTVTAGWPVDWFISMVRGGATPNGTNIDRLRGGSLQIKTTATDAEASSVGPAFDNMTGVYLPNNYINDIGERIDWMFRRAPGFFDMVCYTGTGSTMTVSHNLAAVPELMIVKSRSNATNWIIYNQTTGNTKYFVMPGTAAPATGSTYWNNTTPTSSVFTVGTSADVNGSGRTYVAYLFASVPGVSKVGTYVGTGSTQTIDCGFSNGARFVMIRRSDGTGSWAIWDTARGITSGDDPNLLLNSTGAETTSPGVDPASSGFGLTTSYNGSGVNYIFLAIA